MSFDWDPFVDLHTPAGNTEMSPLLVMFHGYGADEKDLMPVASQLPPQFTVASIRAPFEQGPGYTWFPLVNDPAFDFDVVKAVVDRLIVWLEEMKEKQDTIVLLGFSMGMAIATSLMRRRPDLITAVVGLSGFALDAALDPAQNYFDDSSLKHLKLPLFWGRDQQDPVITEDKVEYTNQWARSHIQLTKINYAGMGHGIAPQEISHVGEFLNAEVFGARL
ncbi:alpha/beta hydrolase [Galactobacter caseinivorans]|nr:dienelactone hydrolase family protein [Galactobacter caseinivorans]